MPKGVIVLLVLVAVLFFVFIGLGATRHEGSGNPDDHPWVETFQLPKPPTVEINHIESSPCFNTDAAAFQVSGNCTTRIGPSEEPTRLLTLDAISGVEFLAITFDPNNPDDVEINGWSPKSKDFPLEIPVGSEGGTIEMICVGIGSLCVLQLAS